MINPFDWIAVVLATGAVLEVWHKGSIFAQWRAYRDALQDVADPDSWRGFWLELLQCSFCQSYHVPFYLLLGLLAATAMSDTLGTIARILVYSLAATRLSNIVDGLLPSRMRYAPPLFGDPDERGSESADARIDSGIPPAISS